MSKIEVKFDNQLKLTDIIVPLTNSSITESGQYYRDNQAEIQQSLVYGIHAPLIMINNIVIDFDEVLEFSLKSVGPMPTVSMIVRDRFNLINTLDNPNLDNEIRIQIIPKFDNAYKKINLSFYISNIKISNGIITLTGLYKIPKFTSSQFKAFGNISMYSLCEEISKETGLGFASNVSNTNDDRYVYCDNKSYMEILSREIVHSSTYNGSTDLNSTKLCVFDWWIDMWNNLNLVDIYERYNTIDSDEDMQIWISNQSHSIKEDDVIKPIKSIATISNHPSLKTTELYASKLDTKNHTGALLNNGTDKLFSIYFDNKHEYIDEMIMDGDVKKDIYTKYEYLGEVYGDYNYLMAEKIRTSFIQKINSESLEVTLHFPLLGLIRGNKVNVIKYINDSMLESKTNHLKNDHIINNIDTNIPINIDESDQDFKIDKSISGQYLITATNIQFSKGSWEYKLILNRPNSTKPKIIEDTK